MQRLRNHAATTYVFREHRQNFGALSTKPVAGVVLDKLALDGKTDDEAVLSIKASAKAVARARNDLDAVGAWLSNYANTKTTFENYPNEVGRLLLSAVVQLGKPLSSLAHENLRLSKPFVDKPQPASGWVSSRGDDCFAGGKYPRGDARWRLFDGTLSPASRRQPS